MKEVSSVVERFLPIIGTVELLVLLAVAVTFFM